MKISEQHNLIPALFIVILNRFDVNDPYTRCLCRYPIHSLSFGTIQYLDHDLSGKTMGNWYSGTRMTKKKKSFELDAKGQFIYKIKMIIKFFFFSDL
ncbi:hypothetical protein RCL_jg28665.t1 [Rhizophagus clarus]|uniref:Uncharacterized protein n=1 Tax=Rhizophagus clarus TaxID=94130 RepID=A0A8H3LTT1_9GLOM|nr:hypothetical protein RCL_jg28665.t1 [Rhizophagus clarus]